MFEDLITGFGRNPEMKPDYTNETLRAFAANIALSLDERLSDSAFIKQAFEKFGLDPLNPFNWHRLLGYFARAHFEPGRRGRPKETKKWKDHRLLALAYGYITIKNEKPRWSQQQICREIKKRWPQGFKETPETLRRNLGPAVRAAKAYTALRTI
jgi:hypothetical protein